MFKVISGLALVRIKTDDIKNTPLKFWVVCRNCLGGMTAQSDPYCLKCRAEIFAGKRVDC